MLRSFVYLVWKHSCHLFFKMFYFYLWEFQPYRNLTLKKKGGEVTTEPQIFTLPVSYISLFQHLRSYQAAIYSYIPEIINVICFCIISSVIGWDFSNIDKITNVLWEHWYYTFYIDWQNVYFYQKSIKINLLFSIFKSKEKNTFLILGT